MENDNIKNNNDNDDDDDDAIDDETVISSKTTITINENNCDNNKSPVEKESCQFLKCIPKEKILMCDKNDPNGVNDLDADNDDDESHYYNNIITTEEGKINLNGAIINDINDDCSDNACACDNNFEPCYVNQIFAKLNDDCEWIIRWDIYERHEKDFIALCYHGKSLIYLL